MTIIQLLISLLRREATNYETDERRRKGVYRNVQKKVIEEQREQLEKNNTYFGGKNYENKIY